MHSVTCRSNQMPKHMFGVICTGALFVISVPVPPELEKYFIDVSCPRHIKMHYVTRRSH
jgi:hypothetical protein